MKDEMKKQSLFPSSLIPHLSSLRYVRQCVPETGTPRRSIVIWCITAMVTLLFVSVIIIAPLAAASGHDSTALAIYIAFSRFCHQLPERSFSMAGHPLAVCARCTGIYFGFAAGVLIYPLMRSLKRADAPARWWLLVALVPTAVDFSLGFFGILENTDLSRLVTGALLGGVTAFYVVPGLMDLSRMSFGRASAGEEVELPLMRGREGAK
jgi:uncharacterized membrane protein